MGFVSSPSGDRRYRRTRTWPPLVVSPTWRLGLEASRCTPSSQRSAIQYIGAGACEEQTAGKWWLLSSAGASNRSVASRRQRICVLPWRTDLATRTHGYIQGS